MIQIISDLLDCIVVGSLVILIGAGIFITIKTLFESQGILKLIPLAGLILIFWAFLYFDYTFIS